MRIFKYMLGITSEQPLLLPRGARVLSVGLDPNNQLCLWAAVNEGEVEELWQVRIAGTGHEINETEGFVGTVRATSLMLHIFARRGE